MSATRLTRILWQAVFLGLFLWLLWRLAEGDPRDYPYPLLHQLDPLSAAGVAAAAGTLPRALAWAGLLLVLTLVFVLLETAPGDPAATLLGDRPFPPETRARIVAAYGLDRPPAERYVRWLSSLMLHGEFGWSTSRHRPVADVVGEALAATAPLAGAALLLQGVGGIGLGILAASRRGGPVDRAIGAAGLVMYATPAFWLGLMAILGLSYLLPWFPSASMRSVDADSWSAARRAWDLARHLAHPASVLGVSAAAALARFVRAGMLRALGEPFVRAARARGSITSLQAVYVPADDFTDPAPVTTFPHLDATISLSRQIAELGIYPAVDPLRSTSRILDPRIVGQEHYEVAREVQRILQRYKDLQDFIAILGMEELSEEDKILV